VIAKCYFGTQQFTLNFSFVTARHFPNEVTMQNARIAAHSHSFID